MGKYDITALKAVVDVGVAVAGVVKNSLLDGKIDINDIGFLIPVIPTLGPFFENIGDVGNELFELDKEEMDELVAYTKPKVDAAFSDEKVKAIVSNSLRLGLHLGGLISALKGEEARPLPAPEQG